MLQSLSGVRPTGVPVSRMACEQQFKRVAIVGGAADKNDGDRPMKQLIAGAAFAAAVSFAGAAAADTVLSYTGPADGVAPVTETLPTRGQIITVPEGATALRSFTLWGLGPARSVVRTYSNGQIGPVRYAGPNKVVVSRDSERTETLNTPLAVTPGEQLFIGVQYIGPTNATANPGCRRRTEQHVRRPRCRRANVHWTLRQSFHCDLRHRPYVSPRTYNVRVGDDHLGHNASWIRSALHPAQKAGGLTRTRFVSWSVR